MRYFSPRTLLYSALAAFVVPFAAFADPGGVYTSGGTSGYTFAGVVKYQVLPILNGVIVLLISVALAVFFIGLIRLIASSGGAKEKVNGRELILWGIISLFVMVCVWGIVNVLKATFIGS